MSASGHPVITGAGLDLFDVARMEREAARQGTPFLDELFSGDEQAACARGSRPAVGYAARFAVKEACFKALGTGKIGTMAWRDIEAAAAGPGRFVVTLRGETARLAERRGICRLLVAWSATRRHAVAWVVAEGDGVAEDMYAD
jgi:holo-[acyl-carrier protein] synthase